MADQQDKVSPRDAALDSIAPSTAALMPVIQQVTGGNPGGAVAAVEGAQKTDQSFFDNLFSSVQKVASQTSAVFQAGMQAGANMGSSGSSIADAAKAVAGSQATLGAGAAVAKAAVTANDELQNAKAAKAVAADAIQLGLNPGSPDVVKTNQAIADVVAQSTEHTTNLNEMRKVGFFDNPGAYLLNHIIRIPLEQGRLMETSMTAKSLADTVGKQVETLKNRSLVDTAINSVHTTERAAAAATAVLSEGLQQSLEPLNKAAQLATSAYHLDVARQQAATSAGFLALAKEKQPYEIEALKENTAMQPLRMQHLQNELALDPIRAQNAGLELSLNQKRLDYFDVDKQLKEAQTEQTRIINELQIKAKTDAAAASQFNLSMANKAWSAFGLAPSNIEGLNALRPEQREALVTIGMNLATNGYAGIKGNPVATKALYEAAKVPYQDGPESHLPGWQDVNQTENKVIRQIQQEGLKTGKQLTGRQLQEALEAGVRTDYINRQVAGWNSNNGIFSLPSVDTLVNQKWAQENQVIQALRASSVDSNGNLVSRPTDGTLLLNTAAGLVKSGKLSEDQAVTMLSDAAKHIQNDANVAQGFARLGIPLLNNFNVNFNKNGFAIGNRADSVDLFNRAQTLAKLRNQVAGIVTSGKDFLAPSAPLTDTSLSGRINRLRGAQ